MTVQRLSSNPFEQEQHLAYAQAQADYHDRYQGHALSEQEALSLIKATVQEMEESSPDWQTFYLAGQQHAILTARSWASTRPHGACEGRV